MPLNFTKMHGLGNDYVYVDLFEQRVADAPSLARAMSDRHRGVGADGLILVGPPDDPTRAEVRMIMYNADGSRAQMCGNGIRCVGKLAYERGWARANPLRVETDAGVLPLELQIDRRGRVQQVRVDMGVPLLEPARIPVRYEGRQALSIPVTIAGRVLRGTCVSMGNPHIVFFEPDPSTVPLRDWGPQIETLPLFPERINVHFARVLRSDCLEAITWERGTGPTQACGTGACAVAVAGAVNRLSGRSVAVRLPGGELHVDWDERTGHVFQTGPAVEVFTGIWPD